MQWVAVCSSATSSLSSSEQDACSPSSLGWNFPEAPLGAAIFFLKVMYEVMNLTFGGSMTHIGLLADVEGWRQTLAAFTAVWPPCTTAHQGLHRFCICTERTAAVAGRMVIPCQCKRQHRKQRFNVEINVPLVLLCLLCVSDIVMGESTVLFPRLTGDFNFLQCTSLDLIQLFLSWHVVVMQYINTLTAVFSGLNKINVLVKYWLTIFLGWALTRVVVRKLLFSFVISFHLILMCGMIYMVVIFLSRLFILTQSGTGVWYLY